MPKWLDRIASIFRGESARPTGLVRVRSRWDAAVTSDENSRHWAAAATSYYAAHSEATPSVRRTLRLRSRYETQNNCYAAGLISTLAGDVVGRGPKLQILTDYSDFNNTVEARWREWSRRVNLAEKLRILEECRRRDGEGFAVLSIDPSARGVMLDIRLVEADQIADPPARTRLSGDDGVNVDDDGRVVSYWLLNRHPGDFRGITVSGTLIPAGQVLHWYRPRRPGQYRGIPELAPALPLFAQLRRYTLATLSAAETAANIAGVLETNAPAGDPADVEPMVSVEFSRNMLTTMPAGWKMSQLRPEQPTTNYPQFVDTILREIGRCLDVPFGVMTGDSSRYNYSSARLDHQSYDLRRDQDREQLSLLLDRLFEQWLAEAVLVPDYLPPIDLMPHEVQRSWLFDARPSIDPAKESAVDNERLANGTTTLSEIFAAAGQDWETQLRQRAREISLTRELGLPMPWAGQATGGML